MVSRDRPTILCRYTTLPVVLDSLLHKRITLLSPESWEDRNDAYSLERYKARMGYSTVLAICFTERAETFHHWRIFSGGSSGVCVEFDKRKLLRSISGDTAFRSGRVEYQWAYSLERAPPLLGKLPFLKHKAFEDEGEFRIVYESKSDA